MEVLLTWRARRARARQSLHVSVATVSGRFSLYVRTCPCRGTPVADLALGSVSGPLLDRSSFPRSWGATRAKALSLPEPVAGRLRGLAGLWRVRPEPEPGRPGGHHVEPGEPGTAPGAVRHGSRQRGLCAGSGLMPLGVSNSDCEDAVCFRSAPECRWPLHSTFFGAKYDFKFSHLHLFP